MIEAIQRFVSTLRREGVEVTPAEAIDASRAVRLVGIERKEDFRLALRLTLAKTRPEVEVFDRVFRSFFKAPPGKKRGGRGVGPSTGVGGKKTHPRAEASEGPRPGRPARIEDEPRRRRGRLKVILDRKSGEPSVRQGPRRPVGVVERGREGRRQSGGRGKRRSPDAAVPADPSLAREVARALRAIRLRSGRRLRRRRRGTLWGARVMRLNVGTEGVPFVLPFRRRRARRPRILLLVDVSWSVMRTSSVFLTIAREALASIRRTSVYLFVDRCFDASEQLARDTRPDPESIGKLVSSAEDLDPGAPSDYGRAFYQAAHSRAGGGPGPVTQTGSDAILVVMGDARSNFRDPQAWAFDDLAARCRRVIWLNPEPASLWNTGDSVLSEYLPSCDVVCEATDIDGLARGVGEIIRSL